MLSGLSVRLCGDAVCEMTDTEEGIVGRDLETTRYWMLLYLAGLSAVTRSILVLLKRVLL